MLFAMTLFALVGCTTGSVVGYEPFQERKLFDISYDHGAFLVGEVLTYDGQFCLVTVARRPHYIKTRCKTADPKHFIEILHQAEAVHSKDCVEGMGNDITGSSFLGTEFGGNPSFGEANCGQDVLDAVERGFGAVFPDYEGLGQWGF